MTALAVSVARNTSRYFAETKNLCLLSTVDCRVDLDVSDEGVKAPTDLGCGMFAQHQGMVSGQFKISDRLAFLLFC